MTYKDPMLLDSWIDFNCEKWQLSSKKILLGPKKGTSWELQSVIYLNSKNQIVNPPRNPYLPVEFKSSSDSVFAMNNRKRQATEALLNEYLNHQIVSSINLSPLINDVRPFAWAGMRAEPRYTYYITLDGYRDRLRSGVLGKARKATKLGYTCELSHDFININNCLKGPESRKGFNHLIDAEDLSKLSDYMGDNLICILAKNSEGMPVGAWVSIILEDGLALGWSAGVETNALRDGVNNLLGDFNLNYFHTLGCQAFDFVGANIPSVATMKEDWGGELVTYYTIKPQSPRNQLIDNLQFAKRMLSKHRLKLK